MSCIFCKIVAGEIPSNKILEDDKFLAFHDINPKAPIHILIIPKAHYESFQEVDFSIMSDMTKFIQSLAVMMGMDKNGYRLIVNCGENGGQDVMHLHFHLLGGTKLDWDHQAQINTQDNF